MTTTPSLPERARAILAAADGAMDGPYRIEELPDVEPDRYYVSAHGEPLLCGAFIHDDQERFFLAVDPATVRALCEAVVRAAWQPIETAPKDGTRVILFGRFLPYDILPGGSPIQVIAGWRSLHSSGQDYGWYIAGSLNKIDSVNADFTHWMPLPDPPARAALEPPSEGDDAQAAEIAQWRAQAGDLHEKCCRLSTREGELVRKVNEQTAEIAGLKAELAEIKDVREWGGILADEHEGDRRADIARLTERCAGLEEALRPFVAFADQVEQRYRKRGGDPDSFPDTHPFASIEAHQLPCGVWRRASAALSATSSQPEGQP